ncbi:DUF6095 family protein [Ichthyenterobacterium magnum]|uniref:Uncharacterized protein n=1 Tax=Ichthyenterobacterium magnum TaxID=1230530 RepID=A0A420DLC5_9FLAO|nr:DUF6095 family protein [Ichthyenterobacterium magnum]RKE95043.1 hypothetical protein BXY80_1226 [Ichthyenterobacterium magnum]
METNKTDKDLLVKGLKTMGITLVLMFLGPTLLYIVLGNNDKPFYIPLLIISIAICGLAIFFGFRGLKIIMDSMFKK